MASIPRAHEIDYELYGEDLQYVEVDPRSGRGLHRGGGSVPLHGPGIAMQTIFGDGSARTRLAA